ncbi:hypothetical protein T4A_4729 [Trichinella pseudospiralis]|uniref:Uncharacterized protein n=1 Tax=Trichinella pseudospiralis TaxID=6337 RepID=A0A0V1ET82_TRIPS|nr:hypothetical protein T4A_4729 [Trichinella pseudospiralis]
MRLSVNPKRSQSVSHNRALRFEIYAVHLRESEGSFVANKNIDLTNLSSSGKAVSAMVPRCRKRSCVVRFGQRVPSL